MQRQVDFTGGQARHIAAVLNDHLFDAKRDDHLMHALHSNADVCDCVFSSSLEVFELVG